MRHSLPLSLLLVTSWLLLSAFSTAQIQCPITGYYPTSDGDYNTNPDCEVDGTLDNLFPNTFINKGGALLDIYGTLNNSGTVNNVVDGGGQGQIVIESSGHLINNNTVNNYGVVFSQGTFTNNEDVFNYGDFGNQGALTNSGIFSSSGTLTNVGSITNASFAFQSSGYFLQGGHLVNNATFTNLAGGTIDVVVTPFAGTPTIDNTRDFQNGGVLNLDGVGGPVFFNNSGNLFNEGVLNVINGGTLNNQVDFLNDSGTVQISNGGTLNNTGTFYNFATLMNGPGGTVNNTGIIYSVGIDNRGTIDLENNAELNITGDVTNSGTISTSANILGLGGNTISIDGKLTNVGSLILGSSEGYLTESGDTVTIGSISNSGTILLQGDSFVGSTLNVNGDLANSGGLTTGYQLSNLETINIHGNLYNSGTISTLADTRLTIDGLATNSGNIDLTGGAGFVSVAMDVHGGLTNNGSITIGRNDVFSVDGTLNNQGSIAMSGSGMGVGGDVINSGSIHASPFEAFSNNYLSIAGELQNSGSFVLDAFNPATDATIGSIRNTTTGSIEVLSANTLTVGHDVDNFGLINEYGNGAGLNVLTIGGQLTNEHGAYVTLQSDRILEQNDVVNIGSVLNKGAVSVGSGITLNVTGGPNGEYYKQAGGVTTVDGTFFSPTIDIQGGKLMGTGTINGNVKMGGTMAPGDSPGLLTINNDYTQTSVGTFELEISSYTEFDQLTVGGVVSLDGKLDIVLAQGFNPRIGTEYTFLLFDPTEQDLTGIGTFSDIENLYFNNGTEAWQVEYNTFSGGVVIEAVANHQPIPEPSTLLLFGSALSLLGYKLRTLGSKNR